MLSSVGCKTQNSGLRSKEEKPRDPINQSSRRNTQEGLLSVAQTGWLISWEAGHPGTANWASFYGQKNHIISILQTGYKAIGYMFAKQSYWYKRRGLLFKLRRRGFSALPRAFTGCILIGWLQVTRWGGESHRFTGNRNPSRLPASPSPGSPT